MMRLRRLAVMGLSALCLSGCTLVSTSSSPSLINPNNVPLGLLNPTIPFTDYAQVRWVTRDIFLLDHDNQVVPVPRSMTAPPTLAAVFYYETQGPTPIEIANGLTSQVGTLVVTQANIEDGVALVYVNKALNQLSPAQQRLAAGQLLYTADAMGATRGIEIFIDQTPFTLALRNGEKVQLVTPSDLAYLKKA